MKLIRRIFTLSAVTLMIALTPNAFSQSTGIGIEGGLNLADISFSTNSTTSSKTGMMVGMFSDVGITKVFSIRPGLRYVMKGMTSSNNNGFANNSITDKISYLEFPALLKVSFPLTEVRPYVIAGPTLGIMLSATEDVTNAGFGNTSSDVSQFVETIDFGLYFGGGVDFHVAKKLDMFVGAGYSLGLTNILKPNPNNFQQVTAKNLGIQITSGIKFGL